MELRQGDELREGEALRQGVELREGVNLRQGLELREGQSSPVIGRTTRSIIRTACVPIISSVCYHRGRS